MTEPQDRIAQLEQQVAFLLGELERERRRSNSLWDTVRSEFIKEDNSEEAAEFWADRISDIINNWVNAKRSDLNHKIATTGVMPPYTQCLNELAMSLSPPGAELPEFTEVPAEQYHTIGRQPEENPYANMSLPVRRPVSEAAPASPNQLDINGASGCMLEGEVIRPKFNAPRPFSELPRVNVPGGAPESTPVPHNSPPAIDNN